MSAPDNLSKLQYDAGVSILGPVFAYYFDRLHKNIVSFETQHDAKILFASRAGVRIQQLYQDFLQRRGHEVPKHDMFWISRFMVSKGLWNSAPALVSDLLAKEFAWSKCADIAQSIFRAEGGLPADFPSDDPSLELKGAAFDKFVSGQSPAAQYVETYLRQQSTLFEEYISQLLCDKSTAVIVDTGWQGTAQNMLQRGFPKIDWWGLYIGRSYFPESDRTFARQMIGILFESDNFIPADPATSIVLHRHLFEAVLEPAAPSIERLAHNGNSVYAPDCELLIADAPTRASAPLYQGVRDYLSELPDGVATKDIICAYQNAIPKLARALCFPSKDDSYVFGQFDRSADFGRTLKVPTLVTSADDQSVTAEDRIAKALWPAGQIAIEYPSDIALPRQRQAAGLNRDQQRAIVSGVPLPNEVEPAQTSVPAVAVIMRTMDRPTFLRRALESVANQTFQDFRLVIICDGGPIAPVLDVVQASTIDQRRVVVIDNVVNGGMEAASNRAIRSSESEFIVIHDDDDSWDPRFLEKTVQFLRSKAGQKYGGVVTHCWYVSEEVTPTEIVIHERRPYHDWVDNVQIAEMACNNFFAPISFVFRRTAYEQVGPFDEKLPVLGDWDFNIRFLLKFDIGVLKEKLSFYHHRDIGNKHLFANSVIGDIDKHAEYSAIMRNKYVRNARHAQSSQNDSFVAVAHIYSDIRTTIRSISEKVDGITTGSPGQPGKNGHLDVSDYRWVHLCHMAGRITSLQEQLSAAETDLKRTAWTADDLWVGLKAKARPLPEHPGIQVEANEIIQHALDLRWVVAITNTQKLLDDDYSIAAE
ncbi:glycosyltransferase family 2 protein [Microvirga aerilata]|uniref:Glycosyltransferase family 2 protein n=1 Tax=Microvirga aerilata TaxID=670292 RepID=A0A936ZI30_9HYPH|nr:glycosyltransferase family A protein [Microvirga aerilata]MBL0406325.1 glycosyltransferase family 2 protein [Microvirga aerilata]